MPHFWAYWWALIIFCIFASWIWPLSGRKNGTPFAKRYPYDIVFGKDVLPLTQKYPRYTANARLVTRDTAYRILCRENLELAKRFSNTLDSGYAYVQGKRTFELTYKNSPRLLVVNTPHDSTVKVSQWIRDFMLDVELQRKRDIELLRQYICSVSPEMLSIYDETLEATRAIARENDETMEATREMDETMESTRAIAGDETMEATREMTGNYGEYSSHCFRNDETMEATREMDETIGENRIAFEKWLFWGDQNMRYGKLGNQNGWVENFWGKWMVA
ncbi:hypothetical protein TNIN_228621 [Trichonephila inaurata madagascariensis]|uniref:Uncharacterized protein n=1 Tax=Trichonephila inaurata madagascariensis TaxID=2747483 RepID=A0A8X6WTV1_9ARAC|nr:hypothetical protein TNIN_228621 [Trichonephila inaurata madagascariensis]